MPNEKIYPDQSFIDAIITQASAADVAEIVGCNARVATLRLKVLVESNKINGNKRRGRWVFWV